MSLLKYFKPVLPSSAQTGIGESATLAANKEVEKITEPPSTSRKRKQYATYTEEDRGKIGRYAAENGNVATLKRFKSEYKDLVESTVRSFKKKYLAAVAEKRAAQDYTEVSAIPSLKRGRPLTLGEIDGEVQQYLRALRAAGTPVNSAIVIASAKGIVMTKNRSLLAEYGGHIVLTSSWAKSLLIRMGMVYRKASTTRCKLSPQEFDARRATFLQQVAGMVKVSYYNYPSYIHYFISI